MQINFKSNGIELTDGLKKYAESKVLALTKLLGGIKEDNVRFDIELAKNDKRKSGNLYRADFVVLAGKIDMHAIGHGESMNAAIDGAQEELARRLRRDKKKQASLLRKGSLAVKKIIRWGE